MEYRAVGAVIASHIQIAAIIQDAAAEWDDRLCGGERKFRRVAHLVAVNEGIRGRAGRIHSGDKLPFQRGGKSDLLGGAWQGGGDLDGGADGHRGQTDVALRSRRWQWRRPQTRLNGNLRGASNGIIEPGSAVETQKVRHPAQGGGGKPLRHSRCGVARDRLRLLIVAGGRFYQLVAAGKGGLAVRGPGQRSDVCAEAGVGGGKVADRDEGVCLELRYSAPG